MGFYIDNIGTSYREKIKNLIEKHGATITIPVFKKDLVVVVDNGMFAAAGYAFNENEFNVFANPSDKRPKTWLIVPNAASLSGFE